MNDLTELKGHYSIDTGNVAVVMFKEGQKWRIKISVFGKPDLLNMRAGANSILKPEDFANAKQLKDGDGRMAAMLAKNVEKRTQGKHDACVDETDAYKGAVELLEDCLLQLHFEGKA